MSRIKLSRSFLVKVGAIAVVSAVPAAVYTATRTNAGRFVAYTPKETTREYRAEAASLTLAPGWRWPSVPIASKGPDGRGMMYQRGFGTQAADHYWYCSWASRALDTHIKAAARRRAITMAASLRGTYYFKTALAPDSRPFVDNFLTRAERGHLAGLRRDVALNCPRSHG
ncbi:MAG TPA: hypothetical protein VJP41_00615 [Gaiellaceae bacterium]|nr:hypothetical protein [Acidimicrobiales bacterium]HKU55503.1 hypothetical protein [Gaiellaceae bacterium]